jgi:hypothetical protein
MIRSRQIGTRQHVTIKPGLHDHFIHRRTDTGADCKIIKIQLLNGLMNTKQKTKNNFTKRKDRSQKTYCQLIESKIYKNIYSVRHSFIDLLNNSLSQTFKECFFEEDYTICREPTKNTDG